MTTNAWAAYHEACRRYDRDGDGDRAELDAAWRQLPWSYRAGEAAADAIATVVGAALALIRWVRGR